MAKAPHIRRSPKSVLEHDTEITIPKLKRELDHSRQAFCSPDFIGSIRDERFRKLVAHARRNCLFYRRRYERELVESIRGVEDLHMLPMLSRKDVQENLESIAATGLKDLSHCNGYSTSGSSGVPLTVLRSREAMMYDPGMMRLMAERHDIPLELSPDRPAIFFFVDLENYGCLYQRIAMLDLGEDYRFGLGSPSWDGPMHMLEFLTTWPGAVLSSNPQSLTRLLEFYDEEDPKGEYPLRPAFVLSGGAELTDGQAKKFSDFFQAPVIDSYGTVETGVVGFQCAKSRAFHVEENVAIVECLDPEGKPVPDGEVGEIVLTDLRNPEFPMIRYRIGDFG